MSFLSFDECAIPTVQFSLAVRNNASETGFRTPMKELPKSGEKDGYRDAAGVCPGFVNGSGKMIRAEVNYDAVWMMPAGVVIA